MADIILRKANQSRNHSLLLKLSSHNCQTLTTRTVKGFLKYSGKRRKMVSLFSSFLQHIFSSPEHEVLMVSFCDRPMSVVHNFFKHLLLNHRANLDETWQGCSLGESLPKLFKRLNSSH